MALNRGDPQVALTRNHQLPFLVYSQSVNEYSLPDSRISYGLQDIVYTYLDCKDVCNSYTAITLSRDFKTTESDWVNRY